MYLCKTRYAKYLLKICGNIYCICAISRVSPPTADCSAAQAAAVSSGGVQPSTSRICLTILTVLYSAVLYVYHVLYTRTTFRYFDTFTGLYISQFGASLCIHRSKQLSMFVKIFINNLRDDVLSMTTFVQCSVSLYLILGDISYSKSEYWSG